MHTLKKKMHKDIRNKVKLTLINDAKTRDSDRLLYIRIVGQIKPELLNLPLKEAMLSDDIPCYETIRRSRQLIQHKYPELSGSDEVEAFRVINEEAFREMARDYEC